MAARRLDFVEGLRGLAVGAVMIFHAGIWSGVTGTGAQVLLVGRAGVDLFFVLSGFCLVWPLLGADGVARLAPAGFLVRRFRRIAPPYYAAIAIVFAVSAAMDRWGGPTWWRFPMQSAFPLRAGDTGADLLAHLTFTHGLSQRWDQSLDGAFWSLSTEWQFYVLLPLLVLVLRRYGVPATVALTVAVPVAYVGITHVAFPGFLRTLVGTALIFFRIVEFGAGIGVAWLVHRGVPARRWGPPALGAVAVAVVVQDHGPFAAYPFAWAAAGGLLVLACAAPGPLQRLVTTRSLRALGRVSYSAYLVHGSVYMALAIPLTALHASFAERVVPFFVLGPVLAVLAAHGLHRWVERPAVAWSHRVPARRPAMVTTADPAA